MRAILAVITLAASAYCQFRAFPLYLPQHEHRAHYDPCKPRTPHCAVQMNGGQYGTRTYGDLLGIPPYTTHLENIEHAFYWVKHHITTYKKPDKTFYEEEEVRGSVSTQPLTQYMMILSAIKDLIDQAALNGPEFYPQFYLITVVKTLREVSNNPVQATGRLWARMEDFLEQISQIKTLIKHKQETQCEDPNSNDCDMIIHFALDQSSDPMLSRQADLLAAGGKVVEIFMKMATLIENAAYYRQAEDFLSNGDELLEPLVMAGYETLKVVESIESLPLPPTHLYVHKNKYSVDEMLNQLIRFRSDEEKAKQAASYDYPSYDDKAQLIGSEKLEYDVIQPDVYDDYLVNSVEKQDHVDETGNKQEFVFKIDKKQDHKVESVEKQLRVDQLAEKLDDYLVEPAEKQDNVNQVAEKQDNVTQVAEKQDNVTQVAESTKNSDKPQLTENRAQINEPTHMITEHEPKTNLKYLNPKIIINYN